MTTQFPTLSERRSASAISRSFAEHAARALREDAQAAIDDTVRALDKLRECGVSRAWLDDTLATLTDEVANIDSDIGRGMAGDDPFWPGLELGEVHALLAKVRGV